MAFRKVELYNSIEAGDFNKTKRILAKGADINGKTGEWSLFLAIRHNKLQNIDLLAGYGAKIRNAGVLKAVNLYSKTLSSDTEVEYYSKLVQEKFPTININEYGEKVC